MIKKTIFINIDHSIPNSSEAIRIVTHFIEQANQNEHSLTDFTRNKLAKLCENFNTKKLKLKEFRDQIRNLMNS